MFIETMHYILTLKPFINCIDIIKLTINNLETDSNVS